MTNQPSQPSWETEPETPEQAKQPTDFKIKAHLVLEGSNQFEWGVVKDCRGCVNFIPEDAVIVGTWNKYGNGVFWVSITTPVEALVDRATQLFAELAKKRREQESLSVKKTSAPRKPRGEKAVEEVSPTVSKLQAMKQRLKG